MTGRRMTTTLTMGGLTLVLCLMALWGYHEATKPLPTLHPDTIASSCSNAEISRQKYVTRAEVTVSVFNAGAPKGFAGLTLDRLENKGFNPGSLGNAPKGTKVTKAKVFTTQPNDPAAQLVALAFGKNTPIEVTDNDMGPGIDVYVGPQQRLLDQHAPARLKLAKAIETCVKVN